MLCKAEGEVWVQTELKPPSRILIEELVRSFLFGENAMSLHEIELLRTYRTGHRGGQWGCEFVLGVQEEPAYVAVIKSLVQVGRYPIAIGVDVVLDPSVKLPPKVQLRCLVSPV